MGKLFEELKRRKVFKVAVVYAVVPWLLVQIVTSILPTSNKKVPSGVKLHLYLTHYSRIYASNFDPYRLSESPEFTRSGRANHRCKPRVRSQHFYLGESYE
jgi:hypothetical protein